MTGRCDVTDEEQVNAFVRKGLAEFGRIDVVVNNAGWRARGELLRISTENWLATMGVNLHAPFLRITGAAMNCEYRIRRLSGTSFGLFVESADGSN